MNKKLNAFARKSVTRYNQCPSCRKFLLQFEIEHTSTIRETSSFEKRVAYRVLQAAIFGVAKHDFCFATQFACKIASLNTATYVSIFHLNWNYISKWVTA